MKNWSCSVLRFSRNKNEGRDIVYVYNIFYYWIESENIVRKNYIFLYLLNFNNHFLGIAALWIT